MRRIQSVVTFIEKTKLGYEDRAAESKCLTDSYIRGGSTHIAGRAAKAERNRVSLRPERAKGDQKGGNPN
jgi:hypothetical protein